MQTHQNFEIAGSGVYFPQCRVEAEEIDASLGKPQGWTRQHVGVLTRYECREPETSVSMAKIAVMRAMENAVMKWSDIDLVIDCSTTIHRLIPCNGAHIQAAFGNEAAGIPAFDVQSTCLGFIVGLNVANAFFATGVYRSIMLVCSETPSLAANPHEPESAALLGDAAVAVILRHRNDSEKPFFFAHETWGEYLDTCIIEGGATAIPSYDYTPDKFDAFRFHMDGPAVFKAAIKRLPPMVRRLFEQANINPSDLCVLPHQASPKANELIRRMLKFTPEQYHGGVVEHGNLVAAGIPVLLHRVREERLFSQNQPIMLLGTSAGYSQAALIFYGN